MNSKRALRWSGAGVLGALLALAATPGCELLVSFDRSKIPEDGGETTLDSGEDGSMDSTVGDAPSESSTQTEASPDSTTNDGGAEADAPAADAPHETSAPDAPVDSPADTFVASADTGVDSPVDTGVDAPVDTGVDAPVDTGIDAPEDAGVDAPEDTGVDGPAEAEPDADDAGDDGSG